MADNFEDRFNAVGEPFDQRFKGEAPAPNEQSNQPGWMNQEQLQSPKPAAQPATEPRGETFEDVLFNRQVASAPSDAGMEFSSQERRDNDLGQEYLQVAQGRSSDAIIEEFREQMQREFEAEGTPVPSAPNTGSAAPAQVTVNPTPLPQGPAAEGAGMPGAQPAPDLPTDVGKITRAIISDIGVGFTETVPAVGGGINIGAREFVSSLKNLADALDEISFQIPVPSTGSENLDLAIQRPLAALEKLLQGTGDIPKPTSVTGSFIQEAARFVVGFVPALRAGAAAGLKNLPGWLQASIAGGVAEFFTKPPEDPNLSNLIQTFPSLRNPVNELLASDAEDPKLLNRLRNAIDGLGFGLLADAVFHGIRFLAARGKMIDQIDAARKLHGEVGTGEVIAAPTTEVPITIGAPPVRPASNPFIIDISTPEARAATEARLRELSPDGTAPIVKPSSRPVYDDAFDQLKEAGLTDEEAAANAAIVAARYATRAERLGRGQSPFDLYKSEGIQIRREAAPPEQGVALESPRAALVDDARGTVEEKQDLLRLIEQKASPEVIEQHPVVKRAFEAQKEAPQGPLWEDITPEYMATREFNFDGEKVIGYEEARRRLVAKAESYSPNGIGTDKTAVIILGSPAAGKSAITRQLARERRAAVPDADDVKQVLPEYRDGFGSTTVHEESTLINSQVLEELASQDKNLILQKVGHDVNSIRKLVDSLTALGYKVDLVNMKVDPDETYRRMIKRFVETGRLIEENYFKAIGDWPEKTFNTLKGEGKINEAVNIDNNARTLRIIEGEGTTLAKQAEAAGSRRGGSAAGDSSARARFDQAVLASGKIRAAAIRIGDKIFEGANHIEAIEKYAKSIGQDMETVLDDWAPGDSFLDGFVTKDGRFIDRNEAARLVGKPETGQSLEFELDSNELRMNGGQFDQQQIIGWEIIDRHTGARVGGPYKNTPQQKQRMARRIDRLDNEYGGYRYTRRPIYADGSIGSNEFNQQPFYSAVERAVQTSKQAAANGDQWLASIKNTPGVKQEELDWLGLTDFLKGRKNVSRQEVENYIAANRVELEEVTKGDTVLFDDVAEAKAYVEERVGPNAFEDYGFIDERDYIDFANDLVSRESEDSTRYAQYQLPGGTNYRELLLTLPNKSIKRVEDFRIEMEKKYGGRYEGDQSRWSDEEKAQYNSLIEEASSNKGRFEGGFISPHWDEPNVLAHIRSNDRIIDGKKTLFIEEIQSDWHQAGRKKGYVGDPPKHPEDIKAIAEKIKSATDKDVLFNPNGIGVREMNKLIDKGILTFDEVVRFHTWRATPNEPIPDAPFKKTWHELALKRMLVEAAEKGYDAIAWTTGKVQAERYDLSKQVDAIDVVPGEKPNTFMLTAKPRGQRQMVDVGNGDIPADKLADYVGKDLADKIIKDFEGPLSTENSYRSYSGVDLQVGGEGMRGFYDKILVDAANRLGKQFGTKVTKGTLAEVEVVGGGWHFMTNDQTFQGPFSTREEAMEAAREFGAQVHIMPLTPELKRVAKEQGFKLFQGEMTPQGRITLAQNKTLIQLFKTADRSTFMHETGHLWLDELARDAALPNAPEQIVSDFQTTLKWLGVKDANEITREHHEKWARGFEEYLRTGEAPSAGLKSVFEKFKEWLTAIYSSITGTGVKLNDEIKGVMDRLLATDADLALAGRQPFIGETGMSPGLMNTLAPRLSEMGFDGIVIRNGSGDPILTTFDPRIVSAGQRMGAAMSATETGVPTDVAARGLTGSAEANVNRAGIARVLRMPDDPQATPGVGAGPEVYINFGRINEADDVKQVIRDMADAFKGDINEARRGVQTNEQTEKLADELGMTVNDLLQRRRGEPFNAEQALAARRLLATSGEKLLELAEKAAQPTATLADQYNFRRMLATHHAIQSEVIAARTETARALQSWSIPAGGNVEMARNIQAMIDDAGGTAVTQELAKRLALLKGQGIPAAAINATIARGWKATTLDMVKESFVLGLLWSPKTHMVNAASNLAVAGMQVYERSIARAIGDFIGTAAGDKIVDGEAIAMTYGMISSLKDAFRLAARAAWTGESSKITGKAASKFDERVGAISSRRVAAERGLNAADAQRFAESAMGRAIDFIGTVVRLPGNALAAGDEFFKTIVYRAELHAQALRQATGEGHKGPKLFERMAELVNDPPEHITLSAADAALYATFQNKMGFVGNAISALRNGGTLNPLFLIMPFVKTPTNILSYTFERTPLAPLVGRWRDDVAAGGARRDLAIARMATGTALMAVAFDFASSGNVTGVGPSDQGKKEALLRQGWMPNSIYHDGQYYSYSRADPYAMIFSFAGSVAELTKERELSPEDYDELKELVGAAIGILSATVVDKTYFQGIAQVYTMIQSAEKGPQGVTNWWNRQAGAFLPFSTAAGTIKQFVDPVTRDVNSEWDAIMSRIAGLSDRLPPARNLWGEERKLQEVYGRAYDVLSPVAVSRKEDSPIDAEIERLGASFQRISKKSSFDGVDVNFYDYPKAYDAYVRLAGNELKHPAWGLGLKDFLNAVVSGKHEMSEIYKIHSDGPEGSKVSFIRNTISEYRKLAQEHIMREMRDEFPDFVAYVEARQAQMQELKMPVLK